MYSSGSTKTSRNRGWALALVVALTFTLSATCGCAVQLISNYDPVLDNDVTALQERTETFLSTMTTESGTPAAAYKNNVDFYSKTGAALRTMATRAASEPKSKIIVAEVQDIRKSFSDLQQLQELQGAKGLSVANIRNSRSALETEFEAILTLELALKAASHTKRTVSISH